MPLVSIAGALPAFAQGPGYYGQGWGPHMMGWGGGWLGMIFQIAFWALLITAAVAGIRWLLAASGRGSANQASHDNALGILRQRYAKGEINKAQFEEMKANLTA